jgi:hypothetical protein
MAPETSTTAAGPAPVVSGAPAGREKVFAEHLRESLGVTVQRVDLNDLVDSSEPLESAEQARALLAIGAALRHEEVAL